MKRAARFNVQPGWKLLISDMGFSPTEVLTVAGLPADLFSVKDASLSPNEYFRLFEGLQQLAGESELPLLIGKAISVEAFDSPIFASLCSKNLNIALMRLSQFKRLIGPMILNVEVDVTQTTANIECYGHDGQPPRALGASEMVFFTELVRLATRERIVPKKLLFTDLPANSEAYEEYFGVPVNQGDIYQISFSAEDATKPFLTENIAMWNCFKPELKRRLADLDSQATTAQRVKSILLEMLPSGQSTMEQAAERLAMSKRTMQRKLNGEGETFKSVLQNTRESLARHYLTNSTISSGEISFLLGFQDANSFIRAFNNWTGTTPGEFRNAVIAERNLH